MSSVIFRTAVAGFLFALFSGSLALPSPALSAEHTAPPLHTLRLQPGFSIELFARVPKARSMAIVPELGVVFVGSIGPNVHAVSLKDRSVSLIFDDLKFANGIAWKDGYLYIAEQHRIARYRAPTLEALKKAEPEILFDDLPDNPWHGWRYARFGPDGWLYVAVGTPCNICWPEGLQGTIIRLDPGNPGKVEIIAKGVRNSVGFDFHPKTNAIFFTDNGADTMGDDSPPDELNTAPLNTKPGAAPHFGYPFFGGGSDRTANFRQAMAPRGNRLPVISFQAHVAPLGLDFYSGSGSGSAFPPDMRGDIFLAQHGSWNRTVPVGYRVMRIRFDGQGNAQSKESLIEGWLRPDGDSWGRPVDVREMADGSLLVSDDGYGALWRVTYSAP